MSKHYAVIGRIPFDDEDSCYCVEAATQEKAVEYFVEQILMDSRLTAGECTDLYDSGPSVLMILASDSPITAIQ